jgi:hypothetical protein
MDRQRVEARDHHLCPGRLDPFGRGAPVVPFVQSAWRVIPLAAFEPGNQPPDFVAIVSQPNRQQRIERAHDDEQIVGSDVIDEIGERRPRAIHRLGRDVIFVDEDGKQPRVGLPRVFLFVRGGTDTRRDI